MERVPGSADRRSANHGMSRRCLEWTDHSIVARLSIQSVFTFLVRYGAPLMYLSICNMQAITRDAKLGVDIYDTGPCCL
jgi:hypothetical protein